LVFTICLRTLLAKAVYFTMASTVATLAVVPPALVRA
jgi:hypothetical protein